MQARKTEVLQKWLEAFLPRIGMTSFKSTTFAACRICNEICCYNLVVCLANLGKKKGGGALDKIKNLMDIYFNFHTHKQLKEYSLILTTSSYDINQKI